MPDELTRSRIWGIFPFSPRKSVIWSYFPTYLLIVFPINHHTLQVKQLIMVWYCHTPIGKISFLLEDWEQLAYLDPREDVPRPGWNELCSMSRLTLLADPGFGGISARADICWSGQLWPLIAMSSVLCNCVNLCLDSWGFHSPILLGSLGSPLSYVQCRSQQAPQRWNIGSDSRVPLTLYWSLILRHEFVFAMSTKAPMLSKLIPLFRNR